ncbi:MAG: hypothetical protein H7A43_05445 [Verrucomicrobia bacterium]|nr:hypothetical protein [Kiritimatiellia bacterium]MCP5488074.1 hypothetical protein [Verrucomicrobiota bacterium]
MNRIVQIWMVLLALTGSVGTLCRAATIDLDIFVLNSILDNLGVPLADGSIVEIIGSGDIDTGDGAGNLFATYGGTNLIPETTLGDDVILGTVEIDSVNTGSNGTFFTTVQFDSTSINYAYIRFYNASNPLTGMIYWGTSDVFALTQVIFGVVTIQADPGGSLQTTNYNNFVIIPEPSTVNLFLVMAGMMFAMRVSMRRKINRGKSNE